MKYKTVNIKFKNRWTKPEVNNDELDKAINDEAKKGWELVNVNILTLMGYPQSALCSYKSSSVKHLI